MTRIVRYLIQHNSLLVYRYYTTVQSQLSTVNAQISQIFAILQYSPECTVILAINVLYDTTQSIYYDISLNV
jgi:hypothetical protein